MDTTAPPPADQPAPPAATGSPLAAPAPDYAPPAGGSPQRSGSDGFFDAMRRIGVVRTHDRWIGGVAGGVALRFGIDPLLVRGIFGITALFSGLGLVVYGLAWALLPEQDDGRIHVQETLRGRFDIALLGAIGIFIVGLSRGDGWFGWWGNGDGYGLIWVFAIVALVALFIAAARQRRRDRRPPAGPRPGGPSVYDYPTTQYPAAPYSAAQYPAGQYSSAPHPATPYTAAPYPAAPRPTTSDYLPTPPPLPPLPRVLKPRVYGPGSAAVGTVVGLTLVVLAVLLIAERQEGSLNIAVGLTAAGIGIVLAGVGIIVAGLRGRSSGTLGFLAIMGILVAVPVAAVSDSNWLDSAANGQFIGSDSTWVPTTRAEARAGLAAGVGDMDVDLTELDTSGAAVRIPISLGAGDMLVTVPADTAVTANVQVAAGAISWEVDDFRNISGVSGSRSYDFASSEVADGTSPELMLDIEVGAGQLRVVEGN